MTMQDLTSATNRTLARAAAPPVAMRRLGLRSPAQSTPSPGSSQSPSSPARTCPMSTRSSRFLRTRCFSLLTLAGTTSGSSLGSSRATLPSHPF
ncbi:hypothetical protein DFH08DRAFT_1077878 [Mycena albidolilacea]|uniref:Uncharacterized protein n=1 Tax=Mycena albidolilacea TaxID=1033008 RepID=A0AAD7EVV0_9AGAR|nr:hypothetical protein DFH08DRAFT_1077878 [Mycena albidolilacea]